MEADVKTLHSTEASPSLAPEGWYWRDTSRPYTGRHDFVGPYPDEKGAREDARRRIVQARCSAIR